MVNEIGELAGYIIIGVCLVIFVVIPFAHLIDLFATYWQQKQQKEDPRSHEK